MRVIVAAERKRMQTFLTDFVERHPSAVVVGLANNAVDTLSAVNELSPDVTIIDSNLPFSVGIDSVALSRASGLDVAQGISEKRPSTQVILLTNLNRAEMLGGTVNPYNATLYRVADGPTIPFTLDDLSRQSGRTRGIPVFAGIGLNQQSPLEMPRTTYGKDLLRVRIRSLGESALFWGVLGIVGGWLLVVSFVLMPVGLVAMAAGLASVVFGAVTKLFSKQHRKRAVSSDPWRIAG